MDQRYFRCVEGAVKTSINLTLKPFNHIIFTGSYHTAKLIVKNTSINLPKLTLELGGTNSCIIDSSCDI